MAGNLVGGMEGLEDLWGNLKLIEEENELIKINNGMADAAREKDDRSVIGKICLEKQIEKEVLASTMAKVWRLSKQAMFQEVGSNVFVIAFNTHADKVKVMEGRPWLFDNHLFIL